MCDVEMSSPKKRKSSGLDTIVGNTPEHLRAKAFNNHDDVVSRGSS